MSASGSDSGAGSASASGSGAGAAAVDRDGVPRPCRGLTERSVFRMQQPPGHGPDTIEKLKGGVGLVRVDRPGIRKKSEMSINFLCGAVCDSPVVHSISPEPTMPFRKVGGH